MSKLTDKIEALFNEANDYNDIADDQMRFRVVSPLTAILADVQELESDRESEQAVLASWRKAHPVAIRQAKREAHEHALAMVKANVSMVNHLTAAIDARATEGNGHE